MKYLAPMLVLLMSVLLFVGTMGCGPTQPAKGSTAQSGVDRGVALAYAGAVGALTALDNTLADRMAKMPSATPEQIAKLQAQVDRLKRVRDALALLHDYVAGTSDADTEQLLRDVLSGLNLVASELEADGVKLPGDAKAGLAAVTAFFGGG